MPRSVDRLHLLHAERFTADEPGLFTTLDIGVLRLQGPISDDEAAINYCFLSERVCWATGIRAVYLDSPCFTPHLFRKLVHVGVYHVLTFLGVYIRL